MASSIGALMGLIKVTQSVKIHGGDTAMQRRDFARYSAAVAFGSGLAGNARAHDTNGLDRFGDWKAKQFKTTGFFRVKKDDRWWLVTPGDKRR